MSESREIELLRAMLQQDLKAELALGTADPNPKTGKGGGGEIRIPYSARSAHLHVIGRTRSGKSRFIADLVQQDIIEGSGLCLIDPHGELYDLTMNWLAQNQEILDRRKIHAVRFSDKATSFRYNPLHVDDPDNAYRVASNVMEAINRVYGGTSSTDTPLIDFLLDVICTILALRGLPLAAAKYFVTNGGAERAIRDKISEGVPNDWYRKHGLEFSKMTPREFREGVSGATRRIHQFLANPFVERIFSVTENTANLRQMMDESHVLLLNTSVEGGPLKRKELRMLGMLLTNNLFATAEDRIARLKPKPFMLYIDEVQNYVSTDIEDILSQAAKRGLYLTLSHQFLAQLSDVSPLIYNGVMNGTLLKAVFQTTMADADIFADELFADRIDYERLKKNIKTPLVTGHKRTKFKSTNQSESEGDSETSTSTRSHTKNRAKAVTHAHSDSDSDSWADSHAESDSDARALGSFGGSSEATFLPATSGLESPGTTMGLNAGNSDMLTTGHATSYAQTRGGTRTSSDTHAETNSAGDSIGTSTARSLGKNTQRSQGSSESEALESIIEMLPTQTMSLEEQRHELKRTLAWQEERHGYFAVRREGTIGFITREVIDLDIPDTETAVRERIAHESPWISRASEIKAVEEHPALKAILNEPAKRLARPEPESFFEPDSEPPEQQG